MFMASTELSVKDYDFSLQHIVRRDGSLCPLPTESAVLGNMIESDLREYATPRLQAQGYTVTPGKERFYPDVEVHSDASTCALDIKVARRNSKETSTESSITLYTGNTYFRHPDHHFPGMFRKFNDYTQHLDVIVLYTLDLTSYSRVKDVEVIVTEPWRVSSKQRSSSTREYIGAVKSIERLREGRGEFSTPEDFYAFWRSYPFRETKIKITSSQ